MGKEGIRERARAMDLCGQKACGAAYTQEEDECNKGAKWDLGERMHACLDERARDDGPILEYKERPG